MYSRWSRLLTLLNPSGSSVGIWSVTFAVPSPVGHPAPALVGAVVDGEDVAVLGHHDVVGVAVARRVDLDRAAGDDARLVEAVHAAEDRPLHGRDVVDVGLAVAAGLDREVAGAALDPVEVDLEDRRRQRVFRAVGEVLRRRAGVGVAALRDEERARPGLGVDHHVEAVGRVVLLRPRQAAHEVHLLPGGAVPGQARDHARNWCRGRGRPRRRRRRRPRAGPRS